MRPSGPLQLALIVMLVAQWTGWQRHYVVAQRVPTIRVALPQVPHDSAEKLSRHSLQQRFDAAYVPWTEFLADEQEVIASQIKLHPRLSHLDQLDPVDELMSRQC